MINYFRVEKSFKKGFTLIEVLLVITLLAILAAVVIVAINPARQLANTRDATRTADVHSILSAVHQYASNNGGVFPENILSVPQEICRTINVSCVDLSDLSILTNNQTYMVSMPQDPLCDKEGGVCTENGTGYYISKTVDGGRITVSAAGVEVHDDITTTR